MRTVILVCGPPCAGKTIYVHAHAKPGDLILDQDQLGAKAMSRELTRIKRMTNGTAWVIRCSPGPTRRKQFTRRIRATDTVLLAPPRDVLIARAKRRPNTRRTIAAITKWLNTEARDPKETPRPVRKTPRGSSTARGYGRDHTRLREALLPTAYGEPCHHCGGPMQRDQDLDLDHTPDRTAYRGMAHAWCNRAEGANAQRARSKRSASRPW